MSQLQSTAPGRWRPGKKGRDRGLIPNYLVLSLLVVFALGPMVIMAFNSLKDRAKIGRNPLGWPATFAWQNYPDAWDVGNFATTTRNSGILVVLTVAGVLFFGGMAAYSLAKLDLPGSGPVMLYFLVGSSLPLQLFLVPLFFTWKQLSLINNLGGLAIIYIAINAPLAIFLLRSYMLQLPRDFEDAARVDGANEWKIFTGIVVPLSWPGFLTVGLVVALSVWNEFLLATAFLTGAGALHRRHQLLQLHDPLQPRLGPDQRRRDDDDHPDHCHLPHPATPLHRRTDAGRPEGVIGRNL